jgi:Rieske Fe-S protein
MADDRRQTKSKYTADRRIPGAFEGETVTRRRFMTGTANVAGAVAASAFLLPALGFALGPVFEKHEQRWQQVGTLDEFPVTTYVPKVITIVDGIGQAGKTTTYIRKRDPKVDTDKPDKYNQYIAISTRCMHLGCPVRFVEAAERFICPCHGGVYDFQGKVIGGPPVRPLDRFQTRVERGQVQIGPRYSVTSQLQPVRARDPGEFTGGVWNYIYPPRPDTAPAP